MCGDLREEDETRILRSAQLSGASSVAFTRAKVLSRTVDHALNLGCHGGGENRRSSIVRQRRKEDVSDLSWMSTSDPGKEIKVKGVSSDAVVVKVPYKSCKAYRGKLLLTSLYPSNSQRQPCETHPTMTGDLSLPVKSTATPRLVSYCDHSVMYIIIIR